MNQGVIFMLAVRTQMEVICVHVLQDSLDQDSPALVCVPNG